MRSFIGRIIGGRGVGKKLGFPTINIDIAPPLDFFGVFAGAIEIDGKQHNGVLFIGERKTHNISGITCEIHLFDFAEKVAAGIEATLFVGEKIRDQKRFSSEKELKKAIREDCLKAQKMTK